MVQVTTNDIQAATLKVLHNYAKHLGVKVPARIGKADLQALLRAAVEESVIADSGDVLFARTVEYLPTGALKYHWTLFGVGTAKALAGAWDLAESHVSSEYKVTLAGEDEAKVNEAAALLVSIWTDVHAAFATWRKTDPDFLGAPAMASQWSKSERYAMERKFLSDAAESMVLRGPAVAS